jgi:hypothetical protein
MKKQKILISFFIFIVFSSQIYSQRANSNSTNQVKLETILKKCAEYCNKIENAALDFVCLERIREEIGINPEFDLGTVNSFAETKRNEYIYDYQLIKKGNDIKESRTLVKENGKKKNEKDAPLKTKRFFSLRPVFGPVGLLRKEFQGSYDYKLLKEDKIEGRKTYVIEANPKKRMEENPNYGKLWVDKENFTVLKIEIAQDSLVGYESHLEELKKKGVQPVFTTVHYYGIEKKRIRFPSKTDFLEVYSYMGKRSQLSRTVVEYTDYKFFAVDYEVKY